MTIDNLSRRQFLKAGGIGLVGILATRANAWSSQNHHFTLFVGTYTAETKSEGIYGYYSSPEIGSLNRYNSFKSVNPSYLAITQGNDYLYAVNEVGEYEGKPSGAVSAFALDARSKDSLRLLNQQPTLGADPCYVTVDSKRKNLLVANYTGGSVTVLPIRADGSLGEATDVKQHEGSGPKEQQKGPHAHCIILDRAEKYALASDLGADKIMIYRYDGKRGKLTPNKQPFVQLQAGAGPRHLTFHPSGKYLYAINELDSTLSSFKYDDDDGELKPIETVSTLPAGFTGVSYCADVHIHNSGKFLYGSNRGHNSIVVFEIERGNGKVKLVEHVSTQGDWPRNFAIDPYGHHLLVANQRSNNVVTFRIDTETGRLISELRVDEKIPAPVCLKFV
ncbi:MAG TPA: lactonase family protein [Pyrinomonadaceae bacterium]|nr:lactonase family protein [Pyrinomonadaceae bacterium]